MCQKLICKVMGIPYYGYTTDSTVLMLSLRHCGLLVKKSNTVKDGVVYVYCMERPYVSDNIPRATRNVIYYNGHFHYMGIFFPMFVVCGEEAEWRYTIDPVDIVKFHEQEKGVFLEIAKKE